MTQESKKRTVAIIQARMSSSRLPGKVMAEISGKPMLYHLVKRAERAKLIDLVTVATSDIRSDDIIEDFCKNNDIRCFRGNLDDVLDRYYQAAKYFGAQIIIRLTADCPLLDPDIIDNVVRKFSEGNFDYVTNVMEYTYPDGLDTEVFTFEALERACQKARLKSEREHVTPYLRNHPELFRLANVSHRKNISHLRWTVDEPRDLDFVRSVYDQLEGSYFGMQEILDLLKLHPELSSKNAGIESNAGYLKSLREDCPVEPKEMT
ncbi:MAG TPA: glycosyltransferase family protein [Syntrophales bacterium]|nr:glycosyltransferase family protein [Syntrophales bacterium]